jgi:hypothetical protein
MQLYQRREKTLSRFKKQCPRCKKIELRPMSCRVGDTGFRSMRGYYYCASCDTIYKEELREVTTHDRRT